jgi:hypothetical protein
MIKLSMVSVCMVALALVAGCGGDECEGACECTGSSCACPDSGDCLVDCVGDCDLQCSGSGNCDFACGAGCVASCTGSGDCLVAVGDDSSVSCPGQGGCDVRCAGDCSVSCPGSGVCTVDCEPGSVCEISGCNSAPASCPDDIQVCGGPCP